MQCAWVSEFQLPEADGLKRKKAALYFQAVNVLLFGYEWWSKGMEELTKAGEESTSFHCNGTEEGKKQIQCVHISVIQHH